MEPKKLETLHYAAQRLNVTRRHVYYLIKEGVLKPPAVIRVRRAYRVNPEELEKHILENKLGLSEDEPQGGSND